MDTAHWKKKIVPLAGFSKHRRPLVSWRPVWSPASCGPGSVPLFQGAGGQPTAGSAGTDSSNRDSPQLFGPGRRAGGESGGSVLWYVYPLAADLVSHHQLPSPSGRPLDSPASESLYNRPSLTPNPFHGPCRWHPLLHSIRRNRTAAHPTWQSCPCFGIRSDRRNCFSII